MGKGLEVVNRWFELQGRKPFPFQRETWDAFLCDKSGLVQTSTGSGKTLAAALGVMIEWIDSHDGAGANAPATKKKSQRNTTAPFTLSWITPLRALASDTVVSLTDAVTGLGLNWSVELRTSDTSSTLRKKQRDRLPTILVTTPESLSLLLSYEDSAEKLKSLRCIVVDEWHELLGTKRGVQAELGIARLKTIQPHIRVWGLSATLTNVEEALAALVGPSNLGNAHLVQAKDSKKIDVVSLLPDSVERFPWAGHLGIKMTKAVAEQIDKANSTLLFTNTRSQSEFWFRALLAEREDWLGKIAIHHGSIDKKLRMGIEQFLREGKLKAVVCTSSLDLGVDFWPVDQVMQLGSPKGIARAMQRAGRSGHQPGAVSSLVCVPTQAFEMIEFSATRMAIKQRAIEPREPVLLALDVLAQHVVTVAAGGGFVSEQLRDEVRSTYAFAKMTDEQWQWVMDFAHRGGPCLTAYPRFARIVQVDGRWVTADAQIARMHRMGIGTITSDGSVYVQFVSGKHLGSVEESFAAKLKPGDTFSFAGRTLQFVRLHQMVMQVKAASRKSGLVPRWLGGRLPMSASLARAVRQRLHEAADGEYGDVEMKHVKPILQLQERWSIIPRQHQILIETTKTRDGYHHYVFALQGRLAHEGLSALLAFRLARGEPVPVTATFNDFGLELLSPRCLAESVEDWHRALSPDNLIEDVLTCLNSSELARRHFREIARIAGLLIPTRPGAPFSVKQLQASSELFFDVFMEFDPGNLLLEQARREVLERQLEFKRLQSALEQMRTEELTLVTTQRISPMAFPLLAERIQSQQLRLESATQRIERLAMQLEEAAG